jgi:hypothetical protein
MNVCNDSAKLPTLKPSGTTGFGITRSLPERPHFVGSCRWLFASFMPNYPSQGPCITQVEEPFETTIQWIKAKAFCPALWVTISAKALSTT